MKDFPLLIKPASYDCNLRCHYCFYLKKYNIYKDNKQHMGEDVLKRMISSYLSLDMHQHSFIWQGGEPTIMGIDFFKKVTCYQEQYGSDGKLVSNCLQTNGTLLDDFWCEHLAEYNFLIGISIDGPADIHDKSRLSVTGDASHELVIRGLKYMRKHNVEFNVLTLIHSLNVDKPLEIYYYLRDELCIYYHQYIECIEFDERGNLMPYSLHTEQWGDFLCAIFDEWYKQDTRKVSVRLFDTILNKLIDGRSMQCSMSKNCQQYLVVEYNGDVYPCDFYVQPDLKLGNIMHNEWQYILNRPEFVTFGNRKYQWNKKCDICHWAEFCAGDCLKNRVGSTPDQLSVLCKGWEQFYTHTMPRFKKLAQHIIEEQTRHAQMQLIE